MKEVTSYSKDKRSEVAAKTKKQKKKNKIEGEAEKKWRNRRQEKNEGGKLLFER